MYENFKWSLNSFNINNLYQIFTHRWIDDSIIMQETKYRRLFANLDKIGNLWWRILAIRVIVAAYPGKRSAKSGDIVSVSSRNLS